jgi:hypothetical protein
VLERHFPWSWLPGKQRQDNLGHLPLIPREGELTTTEA